MRQSSVTIGKLNIEAFCRIMCRFGSVQVFENKIEKTLDKESQA